MNQFDQKRFKELTIRNFKATLFLSALFIVGVFIWLWISAVNSDAGTISIPIIIVAILIANWVYTVIQREEHQREMDAISAAEDAYYTIREEEEKNTNEK